MTEEVLENHDDNAVSSPAPEIIDTTAKVEPEVEVSATEKNDIPEKKNRFQERINELTKKNFESEQRNAAAILAAEEKIKTLESQLPKPSSKNADVTAPKENDFEDYNDFQNAQANHIASVAADAAYERMQVETRESEEIREAASKQTTLKTKKEAFDQNLDTKRDNFQDFDEVAYGHEFINESMATRIFDMDKGPEVAYHLGSHLDEAERIFSMNPVDQAVELAKLEMQVTALNPKLVSGAPDPITPIAGAEK